MHENSFTLKHVLAISVLMLLVGILIGAKFFKETIVAREGTADTPAAMTSVNLMIDYGTGTIKTWNTVSWHEAMSILDLMQTVANTKNIALSTITATDGNKTVGEIDGVTNDEALQLRWQYWVNNNYEPRISSKYYLKPGDIVLWKYVLEQNK